MPPMDHRIPPMDHSLLTAAKSGDVAKLNQLVKESPQILLGRTPLDNTALHIAVICGHEQFAKDLCSSSPSLLLATNSNGETPLHICSSSPSLLLATNSNGETPLHIAAAAGHHSMATFFIQAARRMPHHGCDVEKGNTLKEMMMAIDRNENTALHQALRHGHGSLALELLRAEPEQSRLINRNKESPLYMAAYRELDEVVTELVQIPNSDHGGPYDNTALHAATISENKTIVEILLTERPELGRAGDGNGTVPLIYAARSDKLEMVRLHLRFDPTVAYIKSGSLGSAFHYAAYQGHVRIGEELIRQCPDCGLVVNKKGQNALHLAVLEEQVEFVKYILKTPELHGLLNQPDNKMDTPLHLAAERCNPKILRAMLDNKRVDHVALNGNWSALDRFFYEVDPSKTLKWNEAYTLLDRKVGGVRGNEQWHKAKKILEKEAIQQIQSLSQKHTQNTTVVAILIATVTFAAAFTMPGGFISDEGPDEGLPILARKVAFKVFLISDTIAMCSSLGVSFLSIFAAWEDIDFLLHYRVSTRMLLWCAFASMLVAFATAMFTVMAPGNLWLAIFICVACCAVPFFTYLLGRWPLFKLLPSYGWTFRRDLLEQV